VTNNEIDEHAGGGHVAKAQHLGERAIVVGGGMGGLFSARVLSDHFDEVVVLDRDHEPTADPRNTIPQGHHFHVLLPGGLDAMCEWFPGFIDDLVDTGSVEMLLGRDFYAYTPEGKSYSLQRFQPEPADGPMTYVQTRPQLEHNVRARVAGLDNVRLRHDALVEGPIVDDGRVVGVDIRGGDSMTADLVVDASGRNSISANWLEAMGYPPAPETYVNCDVSYSSVIVEPAVWDAFDGTVFFLMPHSEGEHAGRYGSVVKLSEGRWLLSLGTRYGDAAPTEWDAFRAFGDGLVDPIWSKLAATATPIGDIKTYRMKRAVRHHYEQVDRYPDGLLPIADSICFFNPIHGQGMSSAAGQCRGLASLLAERSASGGGLDRLALDFFPIAADWVRGPWIMAALNDFAHPQCTGDFPMGDVPDLELLGNVAATSAPGTPGMEMVIDISVLRQPLSAIRTFAPA
jgi:2-polyprenyl-6-methoxyphenol hydroxylase-like FAD-dependent oxidoreductase